MAVQAAKSACGQHGDRAERSHAVLGGKEPCGKWSTNKAKVKCYTRSLSMWCQQLSTSDRRSSAAVSGLGSQLKT